MSWRPRTIAMRLRRMNPGRWRVEAGGVEFLCLERKGGYDLTVLVAGVTAEFANVAVGTYGVGFRTQDRESRSRGWIVPLAPSPLGLAGSLYGTDEDHIDVGSIDVRGTEQLMVALGDQLDEVVRSERPALRHRVRMGSRCASGCCRAGLARCWKPRSRSANIRSEP